MSKPRGGTSRKSGDIRGTARLVTDAVSGVTGIVHHMHRNILQRVLPFPDAAANPVAAITDLVYRTIYGSARLVGSGLDTLIGPLESLAGAPRSSPQREAALAVLNGVLGDHLEQSGNPLAIDAGFFLDGVELDLEERALRAAIPDPREDLLILVHGLCMNHLQWNRNGHDHGAVLGKELDCTTLYLRYNSGRHVSANGRAFSSVLQQLVDEWPLPVRRIRIVAHSMGGLVARSACHYAGLEQHHWLQLLDALVFLGTPHHGAPLERAGNSLDRVIELSPWTAPFARLGKLRSAGIKDLRHGNLLDEDWLGHDTMLHADLRTPVALPDGVKCFAVAAARQPPTGRSSGGSDGLVDVASALGRHRDPARDLHFAADRQLRVDGLSHFDLLSDTRVCAQLREWLGRD